jgi:hypothetical protein
VRVRVRVCVCVCRKISIYVCMRVFVCVCMYALCMFVCRRVCMHACTCLYVSVYVCMYLFSYLFTIYVIPSVYGAETFSHSIMNWKICEMRVSCYLSHKYSTLYLGLERLRKSVRYVSDFGLSENGAVACQLVITYKGLARSRL